MNAPSRQEGRIPLLLVLLVSALLVVSRRPDAFLNAQFWAEDGRNWYADAHAAWFEALFRQHTGYYQTISRITGALAQLVALRHAPLLFHVIGLCFQVLPVLILCSRRGQDIIPGRAGRLLVGFLYLALPGTFEVHVNVSNIQWHLALSALMVLMLRDGQGWRRWADPGLVLLSGLSGPFVMLLLPLALVVLWLRPARRSALLAGVLALCALVQGLAMLGHMGAARTAAPNGASLAWFARIIVMQVLAPATAGNATGLVQWLGWPPPAGASLLAVAAAAALAVLALLRGPLPLKLLIVFAGLVLAASLVSPQVSPDQKQWPLLAAQQTGSRYGFFPLLAWIAIIAWLACAPRALPLRAVGIGLLAALVIVAIPADWTLPPFPDLDFQNHAAGFAAAPAGTVAHIPIVPAGWVMELRRPGAP
ncbi:MAG TPA: hypothetical protein VGM87_01430 [Roseomonas sp.]|jgi:hypothetical protein